MSIMQYSSLIRQTDLSADRSQPEKCYDLAIIGAGISSAYTLIHYIELLDQQSATREIEPTSHNSDRQQQPVKIIVTEKSGEFWTGIPYGSRSGHSSLLISPLIEFIPQQLEREYFVEWLNTNRDWLFDPKEYSKGELTSKWLQANQAAIAQGLWDNLFIPRHTFGLYLKQRIATLLQEATTKGLIEIDLITADVMDIQRVGVASAVRNQDLYRVDFTTAENDTYITAKKLVLAIGSPPNIAFERAADDVESDLCYIDNMYEPSLDFNIDRICKSLEHQSDRQILIVGSNAGTLDTLYSLNNSRTITNIVDKFIILSPNAAFPHRISSGAIEIVYTPQHLVALLQQLESFTAKQIFEAVQQDVAAATAENINISDIHTDISKVVIQALNRLDFGEQQQFVSRYAVEIGKLQRRAGGEYLDVVNELITQQKLAFLKGKFVNHLPLKTGGSGCKYIDENRQQQVFDAPIGVIINCAGFQDVTKSSSVSIQNLIRRKICTPNDSNRGFVIDQNFEASKNCYVMGPLVAGNIDGNFKIWHAESCQRIIGLSQHLATVLVQPDCSVPPVAEVTDVDMLGVLVNAG
jgi:uncharacterized NAD(P)/FAD-binding protein YdhS